ncbi:hypothetical protein ABPG72_005825 [Tetrahymena utriculariae]
MKMKILTAIKLILLVQFCFCLPGDMIINGSVVSQKQFQTQKIVTNQLFAQSIIQDSYLCSAQNIFSEQIVTNKISLSRILVTNPSGILELNGDITIQSLEVEETLEMTSFLQSNQWQLAFHDHFEDKKSLIGWNINQIQLCAKKTGGNVKNQDEEDQDYFLGGHCVGPSDLKLQKLYTNLPKHKNIKIQARVHFFDKWEGESLSLFVDDKMAWTKVIDGDNAHYDICGDSSADPHFGLPVEITIPHSESQVNIKFESNLAKDRCLASFAIDDVEIFVR